jgi:hypothetical protein
VSQQPHNHFAVLTLRRVDEVLRGEACPWITGVDERKLLTVLREHVGKDHAISRNQLCQLLEEPDRYIRAMVATLRESFGVAIGSSSAAGASGYFLISTSAEQAELLAKLRKQAVSILRLVRTIGGRHATAELYGQIGLELDLQEAR